MAQKCSKVGVVLGLRFSLSPHNNGLQIPVGHFLCNFVAPLSHQVLEDVEKSCLSFVYYSYICATAQVS